MKTLTASIVLAMVVSTMSACERDRREDGGGYLSASEDFKAKACVVSPVGRGVCKPNVHYFFNGPENFAGMMVSVSSFAIYSPRGSLLIYPSSDFACDALEYSGVEVFFAENISQEVEEEIEKNGVARVLVTGRVADVIEPGALPVIGRIDDASVQLFDGAGIALRKNPKELPSESRDGSFFGKLAKPNCLAPSKGL